MTLNFPKSIYTATEATTASISPANASPNDGDTGTIGSYGFTFDDDRVGSGANDGRWVLNSGSTYSLTGGATYTWDLYKWKASNIPDSSDILQTTSTPNSGDVLTYNGAIVWAQPSVSADTNTTYTHTASASGNDVNLRLTAGGSGSGNDDILLTAGSNITFSSVTEGGFTIAATDTNTTYSDATTSAAGLMSSTDKSKLDNIASNANNYVLPRKLVGQTEETDVATINTNSASLDFTAHGLHKWDVTYNGTTSVSYSVHSNATDEVQSTTLMIKISSNTTLNLPTADWIGGSSPTVSTTNFSVIEFWHVGSTLYGAYIGDVS